MEQRAISTDRAPAPAGTYSQAVQWRDLVFLSGQLPKDPITGNLIQGTAAEQTEQVILNIKAILEAAGSGLDQVLKVTLLLRDIKDWDEVNRVYSLYFTGPVLPARMVQGGAQIHFGMAVEMDAIAFIGTP